MQYVWAFPGNSGSLRFRVGDHEGSPYEHITTQNPRGPEFIIYIYLGDASEEAGANCVRARAAAPPRHLLTTPLQPQIGAYWLFPVNIAM